jgi:hypothetical protein
MSTSLNLDSKGNVLYGRDFAPGKGPKTMELRQSWALLGLVRVAEITQNVQMCEARFSCI